MIRRILGWTVPLLCLGLGFVIAWITAGWAGVWAAVCALVFAATLGLGVFLIE